MIPIPPFGISIEYPMHPTVLGLGLGLKLGLGLGIRVRIRIRVRDLGLGLGIRVSIRVGQCVGYSKVIPKNSLEFANNLQYCLL